MALLEYATGKERTYLFVITKAGGESQREVSIRAYALEVKYGDLAEQVGRFRKTLAARQGGFLPEARALYDQLLKKAEPQLHGVTALVIVPDGVLWELPFQALQTGKKRYLLEDYAVSYAPSATARHAMTKPRNRGTGGPILLAVGNPALGRGPAARVQSAYRSDRLEPLPEAEAEVRALQRLHGAARSKIYIGAEAREDRIKAEAGNYRILHLATHGILNNASPMYSHVLLSQVGEGPNEDGLLEAWEIMQLNLKAELVVLSACETARGRVGAGEGVIGLTWALFVAGCPTTVVSQWKVDSVSTTKLMLEFHRHLRSRLGNPESPISTAEALRKAALRLLRSEEFNHPFYWAPFVVVGDGS